MSVDKSPPGASPNDYVSYARYWWPDPDTDDRLPYIRKDGVVNHELVARGDRAKLGLFCHEIETLATAAYLLHDERAGQAAAAKLRVWFLDKATRMSPRVEYGQLVPGYDRGRKEGVLDTRRYLDVIDAIVLLEGLEHISPDDSARLRDWFADYFHWLMTSPLAIAEKRALNNHGSWYAAQAAGIALFLGLERDAQDILREFRDDRLNPLLAAHGRQEHEVHRTNSLGYSMFNLVALVRLSRYADRAGVDYWHYGAANRSCLAAALDYVVPHLHDQKAWPHHNLKPYRLGERHLTTLLVAENHLDRPPIRDAIERCDQKLIDASLCHLYFQRTAPTTRQASAQPSRGAKTKN